MDVPLTLSLHTLGFPASLQIIDQIDPDLPRITLRARTTAASAACTGCGAPSSRVHGAYWRRLGDLACFGRPTFLLIRIRRFRCAAPGCPRRTFAEPLPGVAPTRARQTVRLRGVHRTIGLALGGNPGARHAAAMGVPISATTLLRRVCAGDPTPVPDVTVLGVDDWAWRKGHHYGTILVDLERRAVIDLLPDRTAGTLATWLKDHPSVAIVARDRAGAYADGTRQGAPEAMQIADRWHLLSNSGDALRDLLTHHHRDIKEAARTAAAVAPPAEPVAVPEPELAPASAPERPPGLKAELSQAARERRDARYAEAARLRSEGATMWAIGRALGVERRTVRRWLRAGHAPTWRHSDRGSSILDPHRDWLEERWQAGSRNTAALWRDLKERGFTGQYTVVRTWGTRRRRQDPPVEAAPRKAQAPIPTPEPPTPRRVARLLTAAPDTLGEDDRRLVAALRERTPPVAVAADLIARFVAMVKTKTAEALDGWLREAEASVLASFAGGIRRDEDAVRAALSEPWSSGPVEGQVNRLKVIKREMYGRAGFDLLRARVLGHA